MDGPGTRRSALHLAPHAVLTCFLVGLCGSLSTPWPSLGVGAATVGAGVLLCAACAAGRGRAARVLVLLAAGALATGWGWGTLRLEQTRADAIDVTVTVRGVATVETTPARSGERIRVRARIDGLDLPSSPPLRPGQRVLLDVDPRQSVPPPGTRILVVGRASPPATGRSPGWWSAYVERQGIAARVAVRELRPVGRRAGLAGLRDRLRARLADRAGDGLGGEREQIVRGMALGGGGGLSDATAERMRAAGIWHLLAVSGQNITYVASSVLWLLALVGARRGAAVGAAGLCVVLYCLACDGGASVARAGIVGVLTLAAQLTSRTRDRWYLMLVGLTILLAHQPRALGDPGLQLSFAAVAGLVLLTPPLEVWLGGVVPKRAVPLVAQSFAASLATAPITLAHFDAASVAGFGVNVIAVPLAGPIVVCALVGAVAGLVSPGLGAIPTELAGMGADLIVAIARVGAAMPGAVLPGGAGLALLVALAPLAVPLAGWWLWSADVAPGRPIRPGAARAVAVAAGVLALFVLVPARSATLPWPSAPTLAVLDVGQGEAILLQSPDGTAALVDTGPAGDPAPVIAGLRRRGVDRLALVALTHEQADHVGAAPVLIDAVAVDRVAAPAAGGAAATLGARLRRPVAPLARGDRLRLGAWTLDVLWPSADARSDDPNDIALVALAHAGDARILLTADAEGRVLRRVVVGRVDVLKVAHHGSHDPDLGPLLEHLRPRVAVISVGVNGYGHPAVATTAGLTQAGVTVMRTDRSGDVTVRAGPAGVEVATER